MSSHAEIVQDVIEFFAEELSVEVTPDPSIDLIDSGVLDSLAFVSLVFHFEQKYGAEVDLAALDLDSLRTLDGIVRLLMASVR